MRRAKGVEHTGRERDQAAGVRTQCHSELMHYGTARLKPGLCYLLTDVTPKYLVSFKKREISKLGVGQNCPQELICTGSVTSF